MEKIHSAEREIQSSKDKLAMAKKQIDDLKKSVLEKDTDIEMLNLIVENKNTEIISLKQEIIESEAASSDEPSSAMITCEQCEFRTESDKGTEDTHGQDA